jgi:hypothetical protein
MRRCKEKTTSSAVIGVLSTAKSRSPLVAMKKSPPLGVVDHMLSLRCSATRQAGLQ